MRLVYCIPSLDTVGGTERVLTTKVNYLAEKFGYEIYIVLTETQHAAPCFPLHSSIRVIHLNLNFRQLDSHNIIGKTLGYQKKIKQYRKKLEQLLIALKPDITTSLLAWEIDFLGKLQDGSTKIGECHFNKDFRFSFIASDTHASLLRKGIARIRSYQLVHAAKRLDMLVLLTHEDAKAWHEIPITHKQVIPNMLSINPEYQSDCNNKTIVVAGRYTVEKGYDLLLEAWRSLEPAYPDWRLSIYGDGKCREELQNYANHWGLKRVTLEQRTDNVFGKFAEGGLSVLSSRFEGFGMVIIEAMACGLPVVAFDCKSGPAEIITDGEDGLLARPENTADLADKMAVLMADDARRRKMGRAAKRNSARFCIETVMQQWVDLYRDMIDERA